MKRGDVVLVAARGSYSGKPRPAVVTQSDLFNDTHASVTLCLVTSELEAAPLFRVTVEPTAENGLRRRSQVMVDKLLSAPRASIGGRIGEIDASTMSRVDEALRLWLQL
ncbi:MAG: type II toxin-antitoxin system PemK/MazF family toxin [Deltaproteobacteria bacterium]|nr:type II toxin-antitoxin system PemK/MazF family toxin [Deltaproteobacteria bacterium]